jgi:hypothetical protein
MSRYRSRQRKGSGESAKLALTAAIAITTLLAGAFGVYLWASASRPVLRDRVSLCPLDGPSEINVVLIDTSDEVSAATRTEALRLLTDFAESLPDNALLDIRVLDPKFTSGRVLLTLCNPGDGRGLSEFDGNPKLAAKRWREKFREPLVRALGDGFQLQETDTSPILATLQGIALERFTGAHAEHLKKHLVVVSDFIEHSPPNYSQYSGDLHYQRFKQSEMYKKVRTDLHGAEVDLYYVQRRTKRIIDTGAHIRFWIDWVQDNDGRFSKALKLQGLGTS